MPAELYFRVKGKDKTNDDSEEINQKVSILQHPLFVFVKVHSKVFYRNP